ncbi:MAG: hypothetical protein CMO55_03560 [Verrucomicrobiales bacterium]|nr:hypothetical protein [Verrucomicrobiales bacterium]
MIDPSWETQVRSDLKWICDCPSLVDSPLAWEGLSTQDVSSISIDSVKEALEGRAAHRVGYYFEELVAAMLRFDPDVSDFRQGIQIQEGKRTLGELDFLFTYQGKRIHLETALKFYLYLEDRPEGESNFPGPNARDCFESKWERMIEAQVPLGRAHFEDVDESRVLVKGVIFYPPSSKKPETYPPGMNPDHQAGEWIRFSDLDRYLDSIELSEAVPMQKPFWVSPSSGAARLSVDDFREHAEEWFSSTGRTLMAGIWEKGSLETRRLCVVPDLWPNNEK